MIPTFFVCNEVFEPNRFKFIKEQIEDMKLENYHFVSSTWSNDITPEIRNEWVKSDTSMLCHGRNWINSPLRNAEISLFFNHLECLKKIRKEYDSGLFVIFESDVIFEPNYLANLETVISLLDDNIDCVNIGYGHRMNPKNPKDTLSLYHTNLNKCAEGILWTYKGICRFLDEFEKKNDIDAPFDTKMDVMSNNKVFSIYWAHPPLVKQGSIFGKFKSFLR